MARGLADILAYQAGSGALGRRTGRRKGRRKPRVSRFAGKATRLFEGGNPVRRRVQVERAFHLGTNALG